MAFETQPLPFNTEKLEGISIKTIEIHHDKLYDGYVKKRNEIVEKLKNLTDEEIKASNQVYSYIRGLKEGETFAANGMILHQYYFGVLGGDGNTSSSTAAQKLTEKYGSMEKFTNYFKTSAMAARGWAILAYDISDNQLRIFIADSQNQGGVWGAIPVIACDVYEHSYFIDYGSDRLAYIEAFMKNLDWKAVDGYYNKAIGGM